MFVSNAIPAPTFSTSNEARTAFEVVKDQLQALDLSEVQIPRVDVQRAAAIAHSIARRDLFPPRFALFERLSAAGFYCAALPERIADLSLAAWFARQQMVSHRALATMAAVPEDVLREAHALRARMLRVLEYWFDEDERLMDELSVIRSGSGHLDLANDLEQLADIQQRPEVAAQLEHDTRHVRPEDAARARVLARQVFSGLGIGVEREHQRWTDLCHRAWTLLLREYEQHRAAGAFLLRTQEDVVQTYPSLITAARTGRARRGIEGSPVASEPAPESTSPVEAAVA